MTALGTCQLASDSPHFSPDPEKNSAAIQYALNTFKKVVIPPGIFEISDGLSIKQGQHLHLSTGAHLVRELDCAVEEPMAMLSSHYAALTGDGYSVIENKAGGTVVCVGPEYVGHQPNITSWLIDKLILKGSEEMWKQGKTEQELLTLINPAIPYKKGSNYMGRVSNCLFRTAGTAIKLNERCNGHMFLQNQFFQLTDAGFDIEGCSENTVTNTFFHACGGVTMARLRDVHYNQFLGFQGEPGPGTDQKPSRWVDLDEKTRMCTIIGHNNTGHAIVDKSDGSNLIIDHGQITGFNKLVGSGGFIEHAAFKSATLERRIGTDLRLKLKRAFAPEPSTSQPDLPFHEVMTVISPGANNTFQLKLDVTSCSAASSNMGSAGFIVSGKTSSKKDIFATAEKLGGDPVGIRLETEENRLTISLQPSYYLHRNFLIQVEGVSSNPIEVS